MPTPKIIFDCERMKYPFTGLYSFCYQLGMELKLQSNNKISFYLPEKEKHTFGLDTDVIIQKSLHKFILPDLKEYQLWHSTFQGSSYFPKSKKIKKVLTVHDLNFLYDANKSAHKKKKELQKLQSKINHSDAVVAISQFVLADMKNHLSIDDTRSHVIYNGCNFNSSSQSEVPSIIPDTSFLYTIGTITDKKNFHVLPALLNTFEGILVISGITQSEAYHDKIIAEAKRYNVEDRLIFTGPVSEGEKQWYMQNCEAFLFPSLAEGFGLPVVEAMYWGKPVVLSRKTSLPEIGGDVAFYFEDFEPEHMQSVLSDCLDKSQDKTLASKIKSRADAFNWKQSAHQYLNLYTSLFSNDK